MKRFHQALAMVVTLILVFGCLSGASAQEHVHAFVNEIVSDAYLDSPATCMKEAVYFKTCDCGAVSAADTFSAGELGEHIWTAPISCSEPGFCLNCHATGESIPHLWTEPDCTVPKFCLNCHAVAEPPLGHAFPETWEKCDYRQHKRICTRCGEERYGGVEYEEHSWDRGKITTPATPSSDGVKTYTCTVCGETKTAEVIYYSGHSGQSSDRNAAATPAGKKTVPGYADEPSGIGALPFDDVKKTDPSYEDIAYVYNRGLMTGTSATAFAPQVFLSRATVISILWRLEGMPIVNDPMSFTDVADGQWYTEAIRWAQASGIVQGYNAVMFGPNDLITRMQTAAVLFRYANYKGCDVSARADLSKYADTDGIGGWAMDAAAWADANDLVSGVSATELVPQGNVTREQFAVILHHFCENIQPPVGLMI